MNEVELAKEIHEINLEKGFWDVSDNLDTKRMLIFSEIAEAVEADRKGRWVKLDEVNIDIYLKVLDNEEGIKSFEETVKDSVQDEMADAYIRCLDLAYYISKQQGIQFEGIPTSPEVVEELKIQEEFAATCFQFRKYDFYNGVIVAAGIRKVCNYYDIDLDLHVRLKVNYNKTRDKLHNKKY